MQTPAPSSDASVHITVVDTSWRKSMYRKGMEQMTPRSSSTTMAHRCFRCTCPCTTAQSESSTMKRGRRNCSRKQA